MSALVRGVQRRPSTSSLPTDSFGGAYSAAASGMPRHRGLLGRSVGVPAVRPVRRSRPPAPHPAAPRWGTHLVLRLSDPGRLRRGRRDQTRPRRRHRAGQAGPGDPAPAEVAASPSDHRGHLAELQILADEVGDDLLRRSGDRARARRARHRRAQNSFQMRSTSDSSRLSNPTGLWPAAAVGHLHELFSTFLGREWSRRRARRATLRNAPRRGRGDQQ